jgi:hypothetical protein
MWELLPVGCVVRSGETYKPCRVARISPYPDRVLDAEALLTRAKRPLVIGIGGGGDVVGALATTEAARLYHGADPVVGGVSWERRPIDPVPGPRALAEIEGGDELSACVLLAGPDTRVRARDVLFGESRMAGLLGQGVVLVDVNPGPAALADGIAAAADRLGCDLVVFLDVGGDVLAHGHEAGLGSPLCDAVMLAAAARMQRAGRSVLLAIVGIGCDGELTPGEVNERIADVARAGGLAGVRGITPAVAERLEEAVAVVPTEASACALRAFRGEIGPVEIRGGRRTVELTPAAALTFYFDPVVAMDSTAVLARAVDAASSLEEANEALRALGVRSELDWEREMAASA